MKGTIQAKVVSGGTYNQYKELIPDSVKDDWDVPRECSFTPVTQNSRGVYLDGEFIRSAYIITVEEMDFRAEYIRLTDSRGNVLCEKEVLSLEVLEEVQRIKITV